MPTVAPSQLVNALASCMRNGPGYLDQVPEIITQIIEDGVWRDFVTERGQDVHHDTFESFVTTPPTAGVGCSIEALKRACRDDAKARDALDEALRRRCGNPHQESVTLSNRQSYPAGTTADAALRRLRKDRPDLHAQVVGDELSPHAAMVLAGFRPKTCTVRLDDPERAAATLTRNADADYVARLVALLSGSAS